MSLFFSSTVLILNHLFTEHILCTRGAMLGWQGECNLQSLLLPVGRGDYRNYYKGHMDKIKGEGGGGEGGGLSWGGMEGWGEKAYNCN